MFSSEVISVKLMRVYSETVRSGCQLSPRGQERFIESYMMMCNAALVQNVSRFTGFLCISAHIHPFSNLAHQTKRLRKHPRRITPCSLLALASGAFNRVEYFPRIETLQQYWLQLLLSSASMHNYIYYRSCITKHTH